MFKRLFSIKVCGREIPVGTGKVEKGKVAHYDTDLDRIVVRASHIPDAEFKSTVRHEVSHVVITHYEEKIVCDIEDGHLKSDSAVEKYLSEQ